MWKHEGVCFLVKKCQFVAALLHQIWHKHQNEADDVWKIYKEGKWSESSLSSASSGPVLGVCLAQGSVSDLRPAAEGSVCLLSLSHLSEQNDVISCELTLTPPGGAVVSALCAQSRNQLNQQNSIISGSVQLQWINPVHWWAAGDLMSVMPTDGSEWIQLIVQQPDELHWSQTSACFNKSKTKTGESLFVLIIHFKTSACIKFNSSCLI